MTPPLVSFVAWNRMGLTLKNLEALLNTTDDFELHIVDNGSTDGTWSFMKDIRDERIKCKTRFEANRGQVYAVNHNLSKRKKDQYFITVDSDVNIHTSNWISRFLRAFELFPEAGLLGAVPQEYYDRYRLPAIKREREGACYIQACRGFVEGCCQCIRPEVFDILGYWSEENCMGDVELCHRIGGYTPYKAGFLPAVEISQKQEISCESCSAGSECGFYAAEKSCFSVWRDKYANPRFKGLFGWKYRQCVEEMERGIRSARCASIHDEKSLKDCRYNREMAEENFNFYITNSN